MSGKRREVRRSRPRGRTADLVAKGVKVVAVTWVDNSGRHPGEGGSRWRSWNPRPPGGIGASPVFDTFLFNDEIATSGAVGELRLHPDLSRLTVLAAQPGWAWAPADRYETGRATSSG